MNKRVDFEEHPLLICSSFRTRYTFADTRLECVLALFGFLEVVRFEKCYTLETERIQMAKTNGGTEEEDV